MPSTSGCRQEDRREGEEGELPRGGSPLHEAEPEDEAEAHAHGGEPEEGGYAHVEQSDQRIGDVAEHFAPHHGDVVAGKRPEPPQEQGPGGEEYDEGEQGP